MYKTGETLCVIRSKFKFDRVNIADIHSPVWFTK